MKPVFADTSYYLALLNRRDAKHSMAARWSTRIHQRVVLTEFVLLELGNALSDRASRHLLVALLHSLRADAANLIVPASAELLDRGFRLFEQREDKDWSLTDCTSFVVMEDHHLNDALTSDMHFQQAGFNALLK